MFSVGSLVQFVGAVAVTVGAAQVYVPAGWIAGGVFAVVIGVGMERGNAE